MAFIAGFGPNVASKNASATCQRSLVVVMDGKGFGGGEATRDPEPTRIDPNDPKGKQKAIHKADSFEEYLRKRREADQNK
ncbi:hypothetical protein NDN08_002770 [Rhodosorus marinus]|uniref:Uncharacterized protein n=1 Tax=Rhodosorus marinus TaxID=101924 RepID=A0AAV8UYY4_9RHOD|nr:hypothetical protein NDN08_002770 [Rhodosorus marinus]